jgi:MoxR-like ATPase
MLLLDEIDEFARPVLDEVASALRDGGVMMGPMPVRAIVVSRFALVATSNDQASVDKRVPAALRERFQVFEIADHAAGERIVRGLDAMISKISNKEKNR